MWCTRCGAELLPGAKFCVKCGQPTGGQNGMNYVKPTNTTFPRPANKRKIASILTTVIILAAVAFGVYTLFTLYPSTKQIRKDAAMCAEEYIVTDKPIELTEIDIDREHGSSRKRAVIYCTVTADSDGRLWHQTYRLDYTKIDSGWRLVSSVAYDTETWDVSASAGVSSAALRQLLIGREIGIKDISGTISEENLGDVVINEQTTDLEKGTDSVKMSYTLKSELASCTQNAKATLIFDGEEWTLSSLTPEGNAALAFNPGKEFSRSEEDLKNVLYSTPVQLKGEYDTQQVTIDSATLADFRCVDYAFDWNTGTVTYDCTFRLVKRVASLSVEASITYGYKSYGWDVDRVEYTPVVEKTNLVGTWTGEYSDWWAGRLSMTLEVSAQDANDMLTAVCYIGPSAAVPDYGNGSYTMVGGIQKDNLTVSLVSGDWIEKNGNISSNDFKAMLWIDEEKIYRSDKIDIKLNAEEG